MVACAPYASRLVVAEKILQESFLILKFIRTLRRIMRLVALKLERSAKLSL
jgi:hypothetical protein